MSTRKKPTKFDYHYFNVGGEWVDVLRETETYIYGDDPAPHRYTRIRGSILSGSGPNYTNYWLFIKPYNHYLSCGLKEPIVKPFKTVREARKYGLTLLRKYNRKYRAWSAKKNKAWKKTLAARKRKAKTTG